MPFNQNLWFGAPTDFSGGTPTGSTFILDNSADQAEFIFDAPEAATLTRIGFCAPSTPPNGTGTTWIFGLQGVDGAGLPDGTWLGGGSPANVTFTNSSVSAGNWNWFNLANSYACTRGQRMAAVLAYSSGTSPSAGSQDLTIVTNFGFAISTGFPYFINNNAGSRVRFQANPMLIGVGGSSQAYLWPLRTGFNTGFNSGSNPDEYAMRFVVPTSICSTYKIARVRFTGQCPSAATNSTLVRLYSGTTVLQSITWDTEQVQAGAATRAFELTFPETTLETLTAGNTYRIGFAPQTTNSIIIRGITFTNVADNEAWSYGADTYMSSRNNEGSWTDDTSTRLLCEVQLVDLTQPSGGSVAMPPIGSMIG